MEFWRNARTMTTFLMIVTFLTLGWCFKLKNDCENLLIQEEIVRMEADSLLIEVRKTLDEARKTYELAQGVKTIAL